MTLGIIIATTSLIGLAWQIYRDTKKHKQNEEKINVIVEHLPEVAKKLNDINEFRKKLK